jgi:uncharacterized membrane protein YkvA (DUF1232 family)
MKETASNQFFSDQELQNKLPEASLQKKGARLSDTLFYRLLVKAAYRLLKKPLVIFRLLKTAVARLQEYDSLPAFAYDVKEKVELLVRMIKAYAAKEYTQISTKNAALSIAALLYFVSPLDFIPDFLAFGLIDDVAILLWVYHNLKAEIDTFLEWEDRQNKVRIDISDYSEKP